MSNELLPHAPSVRWMDDNRPDPQSLAMCSPNVKWMENTPGALRDALNRGQDKGYLIPLSKPHQVAGRKGGFPIHGVLVQHVRPLPPRWRKPLIIVVVVLATLALIGYGIHLLIQALFDAASAVASLGGPVLLVLVLWVLWSMLKGHPCPGLHCSGCKSGR